MKILLTNATEIYAGGEEYVFTLARYLQMRGHEVHVSGFPDHLLLRKCVASAIRTIPIQYGKHTEVLTVGRILRKNIQDLSIDIIHSNSNYDRTCAALGALFTPARHIATVHSANSIQHNLTHWLRNRFGVSHFIAVAEAVRDVLIREDGIDPNIVSYIPNGVEAMPASLQAEARRRARAAWNIAHDTVVVGNVARLVPFKGHKYLLDAIAQVVTVCPNVFFPIFGNGELLIELEQQARTLGIENNIRFFGFVENVNELYPAFDIYCHSSIERAEEAFPLAILHALGTGLPVVSTKVGGIGSMVGHEQSGFLTPPEQPRVFADALVALIRNHKLRHDMGEAGLEVFRTTFHASIMAERVEQVYCKALIH